jgi:hypothetical protein
MVKSNAYCISFGFIHTISHIRYSGSSLESKAVARVVRARWKKQSSTVHFAWMPVFGMDGRLRWRYDLQR